MKYPSNSTADILSASYRAELLDKLPKSTILPKEVLDKYPLGSDVRMVPETCGLLSEEMLKITRMRVGELLGELQAGRLKAIHVARAFGFRASIAHQLTNCLTDFFLKEAERHAQHLDDYFAKTGKLIGPLHGIPISIKEQIQVPGYVSSNGILSVHHKQKKATEPALLYTYLISAGALIYAHTNLPQMIMHLESDSFWGTVLNPCNTALSAGGSSGGESALVTMRGSLIGVGTDIGGSIRSPAGNCGLYGLRPTAYRVSTKNFKTYSPGRETIVACAGPIAHELSDIHLFMKVILGDPSSFKGLKFESQKPIWMDDPIALPLEWGCGRKGTWEKGVRQLRVGVMKTDGVVRPVKPILDALDEVVGKLKKSEKIELVEVEHWRSREAWDLIRRMYFPDAARRFRELLEDSHIQEPSHPLTKWLVEDSGPPLKDLNNVHQLWDLSQKRDMFRKDWTNHWNELGIDALLMPYFPQPGSAHGQAKWWGYTSFFNLVDAPSAVFPTNNRITSANLGDMEYTPETKEEVEMFREYDTKNFLNAPICLQLVGRKYYDEELMHALDLVVEGYS